MLFRNLQLFRLTPEWRLTPGILADQLARGMFNPCSAMDRMSLGWVPPRGEPGELVYVSQQQLLAALGVEQKLLPAGVVRQYAQARLDELAARQGYKPGRKQAREMREQVEAEMLPRAFVKRSLIYVWIDPVGRWLAVDAASSTRADDVLGHLKQTLDDLPLSLPRTVVSPGAAMTRWVAAGESPAGFTLDRDCELKSPVEERAMVRYVRHDLDNDDVRHHVAAGKTVTRLGLTWRDRVSFVLNEQLQLKRVSFLDLVKEDAERQAESEADLFAANFALMCGELAPLLGDLMAALGGEGDGQE